MEVVSRWLLILVFGVSGFVQGGIFTALLLLPSREQRMGFDGVAETALGAFFGLLIGIVLGFVVAPRVNLRVRVVLAIALIATVPIELYALALLQGR